MGGEKEVEDKKKREKTNHLNSQPSSALILCFPSASVLSPDLRID